MPLLEVRSGKIMNRTSSASMTPFWVPRKGDAQTAGMEEIFLSSAHSGPVTSTRVSRHGTTVRQESITGVKHEMGGSCFTARYSVTEGEVVKLHLSIRQGYGHKPKVACIYLRAREQAAHRRLTFRMSSDPMASFQFAHVDGRFDVLGRAQAELLVNIRPEFRHLASAVAAASVITEHVIISEEISQAETRVERTIVNEKGEEKKVITRRRTRGLDLD